METKTRRTKLPHNVIVKAPGLLPMLYTLSELSTELVIADSTLRDWLQSGVPHERDPRNRIWINGESFAAWVKTQQKPRSHRKLGAGEGYCLHCNKIQQLVSPELHPVRGKLVHIKGKCPQCGHMINRGDRNDRTTELS